jgi:D-alanyl-D-alanine carboxypeptidase (penicillin-binding protein 5/6)
MFIAALCLPWAQAKAQIDTTAKQAIIVDADTGAVLFEKNADEHMPTSSMSKTATMYLVFEALKDGKLKMDQTLPVSVNAWKSTYKSGGSLMFLNAGDNVKVSDLVRGVVIQSGNDAAIVLAEALGGTEASFAEMLNAKAKQLGMNNTHFVDASGMPDPNHYSTARDLATLNVRLIKDFPEYYPIFAEKEFTYNNIKQGNRNPLLYRNIGADGVKTGHTEAGGYGLIGSGTRNGRRVVVVLNGMKTMQERADQGASLLDWGLRTFENKTLFKAGDTVDSVPVILGKAERVSAVTDETITVTVPLSMENGMKVTETIRGPLTAPVKKGDVVGSLKVEIPRMPAKEYRLVAGDDVGKLGFFAVTLAKARLKLLGAPDMELPAPPHAPLAAVK